MVYDPDKVDPTMVSYWKPEGGTIDIKLNRLINRGSPLSVYINKAREKGTERFCSGSCVHGSSRAAISAFPPHGCLEFDGVQAADVSSHSQDPATLPVHV